MKVNPLDWPARPDLEATIAQQQARIEELNSEWITACHNYATQRLRADGLEQALAAERERADSLEASVYSWQDDYEKLTAAFEECAAALQAEREKSARLEAHNA